MWWEFVQIAHWDNDNQINIKALDEDHGDKDNNP